MTNITYFYRVVRDAYTDSSSSQGNVTPQTSQRHSGVEEVESDSTSDSISKSSKFKRFTFQELAEATRYSLNYDCLKGNYTSDRVYKGWVHDETLLAVKSGRGTCISVDVILLAQGVPFDDQRGWAAEVKYLQQLSHPNLVRLFGYCLYNEHQLLVYEGMPYNLKDDYLHKGSVRVLPWDIRMKIALGAAKGLASLHRAHVIYGNFRSSHVHLDTNFNAKLSDFGLSINPSPEYYELSDFRSFRFRRSCAPKYSTTGILAAKSDVYSFGVLLLEILCGQQASELEATGLVRWAMPYLGGVLNVLYGSLKAQYSLKSAEKVAKLIQQCLAQEAKLRPNMDVVVKRLEQLQDVWCVKFKEMGRELTHPTSSLDTDTDIVEDEEESEYCDDSVQDIDDVAVWEFDSVTRLENTCFRIAALSKMFGIISGLWLMVTSMVRLALKKD